MADAPSRNLSPEPPPQTLLANANDHHPAPLHGARSPQGWRTATMALAVPPNQRSSVMRTIISALVALSVLTGVAASANAFDAKSFYEELERGRT